ncbi:hypothetical protein SAMN05216330_11435 [Bradyrhizobium sp. Ghvi]|nr:hypothetical protein SAMN05216330_11435 [Bradyrhizobium sp. Ghvi]
MTVAASACGAWLLSFFLTNVRAHLMPILRSRTTSRRTSNRTRVLTFKP